MRHRALVLLAMLTTTLAPLLRAETELRVEKPDVAPAQPPRSTIEQTADDLLSAAPADAPGEASEPRSIVRVGSRVRVRKAKVADRQLDDVAQDDDVVVGQVVAADADTLTLATSTSKAVTRIPLAQIERLDVSRGAHSQTLRGAVVAAALPAVIGVVSIGLQALIKPQGNGLDLDGYCIGLASLCLVPPAAAVGAAIGSIAKTDRWEPVGAQRVRLTLAPDAHHGVRAALSVHL